ncbi:protein NIM1-INTERACTING 3 [Raphanus sativus]|uniref:Protein NIM1-INTERACTING 3 n=1 Tax=Raphanus sativus TaxID=3726 RepID=A0A6J0KT90_RAPSA|nr:protein NIM1-INTERACTING 3 [Raphanus sativus]
MDERDRKKMKMEKEEEEKMEKLYILLKNAREMRTYVISSMEKKRQEEERARIHRFPSFQPEDFIFKNETEANNNEKAAANASSSASNKNGSKEAKEEAETNVCLDLNLSL